MNGRTPLSSMHHAHTDTPVSKLPHHCVVSWATLGLDDLDRMTGGLVCGPEAIGGCYISDRGRL